VHAMSGYLEFPPDQRDQTLVALQDICTRSRQDPGCIDYWWAEDVEHPDRFRFFECWATIEDFDAHQAQPYETIFMEEHVSRVTGADAYVLDIGVRRSVLEG
jgi:quinol monooxygenase YgiN